MATYTPNYNLKKPAPEDFADIADLNGNADIIDAQLKAQATSIAAKQNAITGAASTIAGINLTANRALVSNSSGKVAASSVTATQLGYLAGATSSIQTQLNNKATSNHTHNYAGSSSAGGAANSATKLATARTVRTNLGSTSTASFDGTANIAPGVTGTLPIVNGGTGATTASAALTNLGITATAEEINYTKGVTSAIQTQLGEKSKGWGGLVSFTSTAGWWRIAETIPSVDNNLGIVCVTASSTGYHSNAIFSAGTSYARTATINQIDCAQFSNALITKARIVYVNSTSYQNTKAYIDVYIGVERDINMRTSFLGSGWLSVTPTQGTVPSGYTSKEITLTGNGYQAATTSASGIMSAADKTKLDGLLTATTAEAQAGTSTTKWLSPKTGVDLLAANLPAQAKSINRYDLLASMAYANGQSRTIIQSLSDPITNYSDVIISAEIATNGSSDVILYLGNGTSAGLSVYSLGSFSSTISSPVVAHLYAPCATTTGYAGHNGLVRYDMVRTNGTANVGAAFYKTAPDWTKITLYANNQNIKTCYIKVYGKII